ncbi:MAG TPA: HAMP domain-containing sensor histidine kinase [Candidatus Dormibacteraeota bacterium]|nr:HAMP domain-containing sensor histidine kinase [Candidatus Dormibacteraeota bacterium]
MRSPIKFPFQERAFSTSMVILAAAVVIVLGVLQFRWSNQVSEATSIRLADSLQMSMINWHLDFFRVFSEACVAMQVDTASRSRDDWGQYARRYAQWKKTSADPNLIAGLYILQFDPARSDRVLHLAPATNRFEPGNWPSSFAGLREELQRAAPEPGAGESTAISRAGFANRYFSGGSLTGWKFDPQIPALVRAISSRPATSAGGKSAERRNVDWLVLVVNRKDLQDNVLPALAERYFRGTEGLDYQVAVTSGRQNAPPLYSSDAGFGNVEIADADGTMNIFGRPRDGGQGSPIHIFRTPSPGNVPAASGATTWFPLLRDTGTEQDWHLIVRHRRGGALGAFLADSHRRDLAISFGVLFLLVVSMAILIITSARAQRLAKLQMDFVTAVSHELRTPLTVISSAAENIAHGVVQGKPQLEQYGSVIGTQAKRLFEMVEQILLFAAIREGHQRYNLRPVEAEEVLDSALSNTAGLVRTAKFRVEQEIEPNLPLILADRTALSQCLQNLITNALKYGGEQQWIGITVRLPEHGLSGKEIQISVSDRGIGIDPEELPHIFEPFYRSPLVTAAQIHGTGLGLPLAKSMVEAMKGRITVKSVPGHGSTFTLHLPCMDHSARQPGAKVVEAVTS